MQDLSGSVGTGGRWRWDLRQGRGYELRPRFGFRPWLAFFFRALWVAFLVRFDIGVPRYRGSRGASQLLGGEGTQDAELVALRIGQHHPRRLALTDVDARRAQRLRARHLGGLVFGAEVDV